MHHAVHLTSICTDMTFAVFASVFWRCVLHFMINQDEHKIPLAELVARLETSLDNVSITIQKALPDFSLSKWE